MTPPTDDRRVLVRLAEWWAGSHDPVQFGIYRDGAWCVPSISGARAEAPDGAVVGWSPVPQVNDTRT